MPVLRKFKWGGLLLGLWLAVLLAGCSQDKQQPTPAPTNTARADYPLPINPRLAALPPFTMTVWFADDYYNQPPLVDLLKEFQQAYPNITINVQHYEWNRMKTKVRDAVKAGNPPDLVHQHAFVFGAQDYAQPLDDLWQQWGSVASDQFLPSAMQDVTWNGVRYGVPLDINTVFLFYNKKMFADAGLVAPGPNYTFTQLLADARKLNRSDGSRYALAIKTGSWDVFGLVRASGGELLNEQGGQPRATLTNPANVETLKFFRDLISKEQVCFDPNLLQGADPVSLFMNGKIAMFFSGPWDITNLQQHASPELWAQVGTSVMPKGFDGSTNGSVQGGGSMFVPKGAKNREAAFELMKWATAPRYQMRLAREMGRYPVINEPYKDAYFTNQPLLQPFLEQLKTAQPYRLEAYAQADITWEQSISAILNGTDADDPKQILEDANKAAQSAIQGTSVK